MCKMETDKHMKRCGKMESKTVIEWLEIMHREVESDSITNRRKLKKASGFQNLEVKRTNGQSFTPSNGKQIN